MTKKSIKVGAVCIISYRVVRAGFALPKERHGVFTLVTSGATEGASHGGSHTPYTTHQFYNSGTTWHRPRETVRTHHRMRESPEACTRSRQKKGSGVAPWPHPIHGSTDCPRPSWTTLDPSPRLLLHTEDIRSARGTNLESPLFAGASFQIWFHTGGHL